MKKHASVRKKVLQTIIPFSIVLFFSFPILIFYVSESFSKISDDTAKLLIAKKHMQKAYVLYTTQAKHRKNLFIRGFRQKDLNKYYNKINKLTNKLYKIIDNISNLNEFKKYKLELVKIKKDHVFSMLRYDEAVTVFIDDNFDYLKADKLTKGYGKIIGKDIIHIISSLEDDINQLTSSEYKKLTEQLVMLSIIILLIYTIVMIYISRVVINPLNRIQNLSSHVSNIKFDTLEVYEQYKKDKNDEIGDLIDSINNFSKTIVNYNNNLKEKINQRTLALDKANDKLIRINNNLNDAINYSTLLQDAIKPSEIIFKKYFNDSFVHWKPKNKVGGDIYFADILDEDENESIIMCIDCTGHSISGAFITMIVKSIQHELIETLKVKKIKVSPAKVLSHFNKRIKDILKQYDASSRSNAGFDGGIIYINKKESIIKYSGANMDLFTFDNQKNFKVIKSNRYSVGYKASKYEYEYFETIIEYKDNIKLYLTTDGMLDSINEDTQFRFGKKRFIKMIEDNYDKPFNEQKISYMRIVDEYKGNHEIVDDVCFVGLDIKNDKVV